MNSGPTIHLLRTLFVVFTAYLGSQIGLHIWESPKLGTAGGIAFGLSIILADRFLKGMSLRMFSSATFGLLMGFIASRLLLASGLLWQTPEREQWLISLAVYSTFSYMGMMIAMRGNRDEFALIIPFVRFREQEQSDPPVLVDSNIIIEGRLAELAETGFIGKAFIVPRFVLEELQLLADSNDPAKREKGKLALERLREMQRDPGFTITIHETELDPFSAVDSRLIQLAKMTGARILSNDSNLCTIGRLQGLRMLNLNDLARALRFQLTAGDEMELTLTKEGRDAHQAVGYLRDGTMIVVNHARPLIGKTVRVTICSVLQTSAGRLFFAELQKAG
ncbi:MAG: hypothetical protein RL088_2882 [Verrucomicrobiota bacterium]|jgi:uncharacterized protein YacL